MPKTRSRLLLAINMHLEHEMAKLFAGLLLTLLVIPHLPSANASSYAGFAATGTKLPPPLPPLNATSLAATTTAATSNANEKSDDPSASYCKVVINGETILKDVGTIWVSPSDPCSIHYCELSNEGVAVEVMTRDNCGDFYCDIDSEVRPKNGTCCGECVRTKCRFGEKVHSIGETWHNPADCSMNECVQMPNGLPMTNVYTKSCPPLPKECPEELLHMVDCCLYCRYPTRSSTFRSELMENDASGDIWTEEFYRNHHCARDCKAGEEPRICHYTFVVEWYETLSKACYSCPKNVTDCQRPHCISGDGIPRSVTVVNRMMPGPAIEVCQNDIIVVDVKNHLLGESTTIHWHGMHMKENPYMDGVPHITQCPISPHSTFRYRFEAKTSGTHFWHSHTGMQRGDGVFGALIIKRPRAEDPHGHLYDFDMSEHKMIVQDWVHVPGISMFASHHHSKGDNKPLNLLLNGKGRYYKQIWQQIKARGQMAGRSDTELNSKKSHIPSDAKKPQTFETWETINPTASREMETPVARESLNSSSEVADATESVDNDVLILHPLDDGTVHGMRQRQGPVTRLARLAPQNEEEKILSNHSTAEDLAKSRPKRQVMDPDVPLDFIPLQQYNVSRGFRYRFRIINAEFLNCPIQISVDNHMLTAINSDGFDFEPVEVGSIITYAGERFDFILNANQPIGNYWIRMKGLMDCDERFTSAFQVAILHYENAPNEEPPGDLGYEFISPGIELNAMNKGSGHMDSLTIAELNALPVYDKVSGIDRDALKPVADYKFFVYYDFYRKDNPEFHPSGYYGMESNITNENRVFTPQLNHISLKFPSVALLPDRYQVDESLFCNDTSLQEQGIDCRKEFCKCHHVLQVPLNAIVEFIIVDEGFTYDANHPFHLHGNAFRVVGLERLGHNVTIEMVKQLDRFNLLKRNLIRPPVKDTVTVPDGGYTIIRLEASNPGFWLFHCHIEFHAEIGMALVLKVGDNNEMVPVPKNFPSCHDYMPEANIDNGSHERPDSSEENTQEGGGNAAIQHILCNRIILIVSLLALLWRR